MQQLCALELLVEQVPWPEWPSWKLWKFLTKLAAAAAAGKRVLVGDLLHPVLFSQTNDMDGRWKGMGENGSS